MMWRVRVIPNRYADSVRLMGVAREVRGLPGVRGCEVAMGTVANLEALAARGIETEAGPGDVVIAVSTADGVGEEALSAAERSLSGPAAVDGSSAPGAEQAPRSVPSAADRLEGANLALVSVPGEYAALEAFQALARGLHVFLFSDHVTVEQELELKRRAERDGLLVMGPGCGTAMLGGIGLGFANVVRRGPVGIVAAAGTGAQETACLVDDAGSGVSEIVGVGGRDLSAGVGGAMFRAGMRLLAADDETETLLLVAKSPAPDVVRALLADAPTDKRVVAAFLGGEGHDGAFEVHGTLEAAALSAAQAPPPSCAELELAVDERRARSAGRCVLGLFSGGSLAHEAVTILEAGLGPVAGNVGRGGRVGDGVDGLGGHTVLDLGEEEYTRGRPHPMVDLDLRVAMLERAAAGGEAGCVLLDVVLGHAAHPDPARELAPAVARIAGDATVLVRVCGTRADPQDADRQARTLREAGALVAPSNAAAARLAVRAVSEAAA
jgi:FdrA protein